MVRIYGYYLDRIISGYCDRKSRKMIILLCEYCNLDADRLQEPTEKFNNLVNEVLNIGTVFSLVSFIQTDCQIYGFSPHGLESTRKALPPEIPF